MSRRIAGRAFVAVLAASSASTLGTPAARAQAIGYDAPPGSAGVASAPATVTPVEAAAPFGARGQFVITGASSVGISWTTFDGSQANAFSATLSPGLDYFLFRNLAIGIDLTAAYSDGRGYGADGSLVETRTTTLRGGPRVGLNIPLGQSFSLYPRLTLSAEFIERDQQVVSGSTISVAGSPVGYPSTTQAGPSITLYVPVLFHAAPHFFAGAGPSFFREFSDIEGGPGIGGQRTTIGASAIVGGTWGGAAVATADARSVQDPDPPEQRFGDAGEFVLDSEVSASLSYTGYDGVSSSAVSAGLEPSVDYFVTTHFSLGVAPYVSYSNISGIDSTTGVNVNTQSSSLGLEPRVGFDLPLGRWLSIYTRLGLVFGGNFYDETSGPSENKSSTAFTALHAYAPLLVHPAPHLFAGFGPSVYWELSDTVTYPNGASLQNRQTTVGASLVVGGWL